MKQGRVYYQQIPAGTIREDENGFVFQYDVDYLRREDAQPISLTLPLRAEAYVSQMMLPFFDGLIPEGWLLDVAVESWKINPRDRMALLLTCCRDCIGAISVEPIEEEER
ncbi:MAG: HipA N-terminal domain-containing protein [Paludibacteraceae bacterium]|nr:HipA N-terminal domain-containing protein [Paludibacteraceae bacterium]